MATSTLVQKLVHVDLTTNFDSATATTAVVAEDFGKTLAANTVAFNDIYVAVAITQQQPGAVTIGAPSSITQVKFQTVTLYKPQTLVQLLLGSIGLMASVVGLFVGIVTLFSAWSGYEVKCHSEREEDQRMMRSSTIIIASGENPMFKM